MLHGVKYTTNQFLSREHVFLNTSPRNINLVYKLGKRGEYMCGLLICVLNVKAIIWESAQNVTWRPREEKGRKKRNFQPNMII